jgi:hypothetical protein
MDLFFLLVGAIYTLQRKEIDTLKGSAKKPRWPWQ